MRLNYNELVSILPQNSLVALDIETDGLNVRRNSITDIGIYFKVDNQVYGFISSHKPTIISMLEELRARKSRLLTYNGYFDLEFINNTYKLDLWDLLYIDVMMLKHTVDEHPPHGLKQTASKLFGEGALLPQAELNLSIKKNGGSSGEVWKADEDVRQKYCLSDCELTYKVYERLYPKLIAENLEKFFHEEEVMPLYKTVTRELQSTGVKLDVPLVEQCLADIKEDIKSTEGIIFHNIQPYIAPIEKTVLNKNYPVKRSGSFAQECISRSSKSTPKTKTGLYSVTERVLVNYRGCKYIDFLLGEDTLSEEEITDIQYTIFRKKEDKSHVFNPNSDDQMRTLYIDILKCKAVSVTAKEKKPRINKDFFEATKHKLPWVENFIILDQLNKLKSTYMERFLVNVEDGIFYPAYKQHGTTSGRYSGDFQQLPKSVDGVPDIVKKYRDQIRRFFISPEGKSFIVSDFESLEPHVFAHVSNEDGIKEIFANGWDFYSKIAIDTEQIKDCSPNKKAENYLGKERKEVRQAAKAYVLGIPYGMRAYKLSKLINVEQKVAEDLIKNYFRAYPNLHKWFNSTRAKLLKERKLRIESGRMMHFPRIHEILAKYNADILEEPLLIWEHYKRDPIAMERVKIAARKFAKELNRARNGQIQGLSASIVNRACIEWVKWRNENNIRAKLCLQIHDEVGILVDNEDIEKCLETFERILIESYRISIPLKAPPQVATCYADAK